VRSLTSHNPIGLHGLLRDSFTFICFSADYIHDVKDIFISKLFVYRLLVGKPEGNRPLERPRRMWFDNIKMDLSERGWGEIDWIDMVQDRNQGRALVNTAMNLLVAYGAGKLSSCTTGGL
jgi:hypothetical protein